MTKYVVTLACLFVCAGCSIYSDDETPGNANVSGTSLYPVSTDVSKDLFVISNTIDLAVEIGGNEFQMQGHGEGSWDFDFPIMCQASPVNYRYKLSWKYLALIIPISDEKYDPLDGFYAFNFPALPAVNIDPPELLLYGETIIQRDVVVTSQVLQNLTILDISVAAPPTGSCGFGNCTGNNFTLVSLPKLPSVLNCGESVNFVVSFGSTTQSSGTLIVTTDRGIFTVPMSGKIFIF